MEGKLITVETQTVKRCKEYFDGLLNASETGRLRKEARDEKNEETMKVEEGLETKVITKEVEGAVKTLINGKTSRIARVTGEMFKSMEERNVKLPLHLCKMVLHPEKIPNHGFVETILPVHENDNKKATTTEA